MSELPILSRTPMTLAEVEQDCSAVESWTENCDDIEAITKAVDWLNVVEEFLVRTSTEGRSRVLKAMRRLEVRIGQLNERRGAGRPSANCPRADNSIPRQRAAEFELMANNADVVEEVLAASSDDDPPTRRKVLKAIAATKKTEKKVATAKPKTAPPKGGPVDDGLGGPTYDPEVIAWLRLRFERGMSAAAISAATRSGDYSWPADRWPKGMSEGSVLACRSTIFHLQRFEELHPVKRRPRYSGKRLREIAARKRPLQPLDKVQWIVMKLTAALEGVEIEEYDLDSEYAQMILLDLYEDLGEHMGWVEKTVTAIRYHLDEVEVIEKIRKMREDTEGRTPAEIKAFRAKADQLERLRVWGEIGRGSDTAAAG